MAEKKKIVFILNPISGTHSKKEIPEIIERTLDHEQFDAEIRLTEYAGHASEIARGCANEGIDIVVAIGGDGTVNEVARSLVHTQTALGIIPCGSGNGLARHLCVPLDIKKAIQIINACKIEAFDYGVINDLPFFCTCGMGFDAFISLKFAEAGKRGPVTYLENVLKEGLVYRPETYEVEDSAFGFVTMENGAVIVIEASWALNTLDISEALTELCGTKAGADMKDGLRINTVLYDKLTTIKPDCRTPRGVDFFEGFGALRPEVYEAKRYYDAIEGKGTPVVKPEEAFVVTQILDAVYQSARTGKLIEF